MYNNKCIFQIINFIVVGLVAFITDFSILYFLTEFFSVNYFISAAIAFSISMVVNYKLSMMWVFDSNKSKRKQFFTFIILSIIGLTINQVIMYISVEIINYYYLAAKIFSTIIVMIWNFITKKFFLEEH